MANLEKEFNEFWDKIKLSDSKEDNLREKRRKIKDSIIDYFKDREDYCMPELLLQGSMAMHTTINPLDEDYDIDCGVYIKPKEIDYKEQSTWPNIKELHDIVADACKAQNRTIDTLKDTCVRVKYADEFHIDFPIYIKDWDDENFISRLAHKKDGWIKSNALANTKYYLEQKDEKGDNLRYIVMFLKAMVDYQNYIENGIKTDISGFELTMMACRDYTTDGCAGLDTIWHKTIEEMLKKCRDFDESLKKPVTGDELWKDKTQAEKKSFIKLLEYAQEKTRKAIQTQSEKEASELYREIFGDRFPLAEDSESNNKDQCTVIHPVTQG